MRNNENLKVKKGWIVKFQKEFEEICNMVRRWSTEALNGPFASGFSETTSNRGTGHETSNFITKLSLGMSGQRKM